MDDRNPKLQWTMIESVNEHGEPMGHFYASRIEAGWVLWNVKSHMMCFVPLQPTPDAEKRR